MGTKRIAIALLILSAAAALGQISPPPNPSGGGGGGNAQGTAVVVSAAACGSTPNCYKIYDDVQTAMGATYTNTFAGSVNQTALSIPGLVGAEYATASIAGINHISTMTMSASQGYAALAASFKSLGSPTVGTCWGVSTIAGSSTTVALPVVPVGGSGHVLIVVARGNGASPNTLTFADNSGGGNSYTAISASPVQIGTSGAFYTSWAYVQNVTAGSYTVTATFGGAATYRDIEACEASGLATSASLDAKVSASNTAATPNPAITTNQNNDLAFMIVSPATAPTYTAGTLTDLYMSVATASVDPTFVAGDVGKKFLASSNCDPQNGYIDCYQSITAGTILSYVDAHHVTVAGGPVIASVTSGTNFTGWFLWGHDDGAQIAAAWAQALTLNNSVLKLPCGTAFIGTPPFLSTSAGGVYSPNINGCGTNNGTVLVPTADFRYDLASGGLIYSFPNTNLSGRGGSFTFQNPYAQAFISNVTIWGGGTDGANVTATLPILSLQAVQLNNVWLVGWNWNANTGGANRMSAMDGYSFSVNGGGAWSAGASNMHYRGDTPFGYEGSCTNNAHFGVQGSYTGTSVLLYPGNGLLMDSGHLTSTGCSFYSASGVAATTALGAKQTGGVWNSFGDQISGLTITGGTANLSGSATTSINHFGIVESGSTTAVRAQNTQVDKLTISAGTFFDQGGNTACSTVQSTTYYPCSTFVFVPWTANPSGNTITGGAIRGDAGSFQYSAAGTPLPTCSANLSGYRATVSDSTLPTFFAAYVSGGAVVSPVVCNGTSWVTY